jgi:hypothetical protein
MAQVDGNKKIITFTDEIPLSPGFSKPEEAIAFAKYIDDKRKSELNLELTQIQGKIVNSFHWDEQNLILEFERNLYLHLTIEDQLLCVRITNNHAVKTDQNTIYEKIYSENLKILFLPQKIIQKYIGKTFMKIQLGERFAWLYFREMPLLIFCVVHSIKESDKPFLSWDESE